ncbi:MAG: TRAP transporter small permease subunit [Oscillibacter sp.]|jgi:TRAP-type C4-dicarboxylate transport system permease small subunit|nr:TRAP transporter small permease subunit [Oscillibacter sp.]
MLNLARKITNVLVTFLFSMLVVIVFVQVVCRVIKVSFPYADELSRYTFVWLIYLGGTITIRNGMNITFDVILDALPKNAWKIVFTIVNVISCAFLAMAVVLGANLAWVNRVQVSSVVKLNMGAVMLAIPLGGLLMFCEQISYYLRKMKEADDPALAEGKEG